MSLVHVTREPDGDAEGALILLHGRGSDEHDLHGLLDALDPGRRLVGITPGAPLTGIAPGGRHWYLVPRVGHPDPATFHASRVALADFLDGWLAERGIGWERTVIGGFSMGAVMSYTTALGPGRPSPAALLAFSGFVPTVEDWAPDLAGRSALPVLIAHGRQDPVIGIDFGRRADAALRAGGLDPELLETDAGHWLSPEAVERATAMVSRAV